MSKRENYKIRPATKEDEPFLWDMLFETLLAEEDGDSMTREILNEPMLARYVKDWGQAETDIGFIAEDENGEKIGAVWARLSDQVKKGYGFVDDKTPELAIATSKKYRGKGIGTALICHLIDAATGTYPALCLSVAPKNPAKSLYEKLGFEIIEIRDEHPVMILHLEKRQ